jgi:hypothetical protein
MTENPSVSILVSKLEAQKLLEVLPISEERRKLQNKIKACDVALAFLESYTPNDERRPVKDRPNMPEPERLIPFRMTRVRF